ncbi:MAG: hypothetical protein A2622_06365 [Bdellovibrionales bacterium RIFCSPHIGHO2_01_FULL_40_29]|nr:MAG: hypothetical protein A2622_06365 [Bdellovibrionales bacterium RIFCSPHIGHO2_01_FULL_40_29]OFZ35069.1 MAG: hypothetical protein A3D17_06715 [Bdellovibrionales bacterium RIFCSPHIGHO2_02_FULL_40_15]
MTILINTLAKIIIIALFVFGFSLVLKNKFDTPEVSSEQLAAKPLMLKAYLLNFQKPERIEIIGLSNKFEKDIQEIKKLKISQDKSSDFYITIKLFSDETDDSAPLVAQIQFIDLKTGNLRKEESINLD